MGQAKGSHDWALMLCHASELAALEWPALDYFRTLSGRPPAVDTSSATIRISAS
jgi:hypothetical protein